LCGIAEILFLEVITMDFKKIFSAVVAAATLSTAAAALSFTSAADSDSDTIAVASIIGSAGGYNYWGEGADGNTDNMTATNANITGNGQYEVAWTFDPEGGTSTIEELFIKIEGTENEFFTGNYPNLSVSVDNVYIDGAAYEFTDNSNAYKLSWPEGSMHTRIFLWDDIGANGYDDINVQSAIESEIKVVFTVSGLPEDSSEATEATTQAPTTEPTTQAPTTEATTEADQTDSLVAQAQLVGDFGQYSYWGTNSKKNKGNVTAKNADIDGNGQYEAVLNLDDDGINSIQFLILQIKGANTNDDNANFTGDMYPDLKVTVDNIYVDGYEYDFTDAASAYQLSWYEGSGHVRVFLNNGYNVTYNDASVADLGLVSPAEGIQKQIKVVFTISGLYSDGTSNVTETTPLVERYTLGDVNEDGNIDALDASNVLSEYANIATGKATSFTAAQSGAADVNADGNIDALDASKILTYYAVVATGGTPSWD
jgi:hypothetical protein